MCSFAAIGLVLFFAFDTARKYIPDDNQQLEYKVRLKYKLNEKYQQLVMNSPKEKPSMLMSFIQGQTGPLMDKVSQLLELDPKETEQFLHHRTSHFGGTIKSSGILRRIKTRANTQRRKKLLPLGQSRPRRLLPRSSPLLPAKAPAGSRGF